MNERAYNSTEKLENETNIAKIIQKIRHKYGHCLKMTTYLQLPVLRITKYHLLLQRYLNLLDADVDSTVYAHVCEALELMRQVNDCINEDMPGDDDMNATTSSSASSSSVLPLNPNETTAALSVININNFIRLFGQILKQVRTSWLID